MHVKPHIILFLDILGYSDTIINSTPPKDEDYYLGEVYNLMSFLSQFIAERNQISDNNGRNLGLSRFKSLMFSDNILFFAPYNDEKDKNNLYMNLLYGLAAFLFQYRKEDFFFRGGITSGSMYYDEDLHLVFGSGLIKAYELESKKAIYPRIVIDENLNPVDFLVGFRKDYNENICFFDYLELAFHLFQLNLGNGDELQHKVNPCLENHQLSIKNALIKYKDNEKVYEKYRWFAEYYNQFCEEHKFLNYMIKL